MQNNHANKPNFSSIALSFNFSMRISDLRERLTLSFGPEWAPSFCKDIAITELGSKSVDEALQLGIEASDIWRAVCAAYPNETTKYR